MKQLALNNYNPDKKYFISVDYAIENNSDFFSYVVFYKSDNGIVFESCDSIRNDFKYHVDSPFEYYCNQLKEHYKAEIINTKK